MNHDDLKEILYLLSDKDIAELAIERGNEAVRIKRFVSSPASGQPRTAITVSPALIPASTTTPTSLHNESSAENASTVTEVVEDFHLVKSHTVGFFRETKAPSADPVVQPGNAVKAGQVVGFIDVLRLFNDVRCDVAGEVVKRLVSDGQPVEYGQALFAIRVQPENLQA